ncbi:Rib/alpha-like domain-containing protein [Enterococcus sp. FDAARGOS_375]|uniref:Rib/alpha-like domain-containing protein n=15 Tax=Enterococcus TaxID=1350 RepID=UPI001D027DA2|nr:Rib/alpha-like domain-containing protein [Enterococcus sp. FDAARGOS_375]
MFYQKKEKQFKYAIKKKKGGGGAASFIIGAVFLGIGLISYPSVTFADEATELNSSNQIQSNLVKSDSEEINSEENQNKNVLSEDSSTKENIELDTQMSLSESEKQSDVEKRNQKVTNPSENNVNVQTEVPIEINSEELTNSDTTQELDSNFYEGDSTNTLVEENALENTEENEESSTSKEEKNFESVSDVQEDSINAEEDELSKETVIPKEQQLDEEGSTTTPEDNTSSPLVQNPSSRSIDEQSEDVYLADWSFPDNYKIVKRLITQTGITYVGVSQDDPTQLHLKMAYRSAATPVSIDWIYLRIDPELAKYIEEINIKNTVNIGAQVGYQRYFEKVDANSLSGVNTFGNQTGISDAYAQVDQSTGAIYRVLLDKFFTRIPGTKPKDRGALSGNWGVFPSTPLEAERYEANIFIKLSKDVTELQQELGRDKFGVQLRLQGQSSSGVVNIAKESLNKNTIIDLSQEEPDVNNSNWLNSPSVHTITTTYEGKQMGSDGQFSNVLEGTDKSLIRVQNTIMNNLLYGTALDLGRPVSFNIEIDPQILNLVSDDDFITIWQVYRENNIEHHDGGSNKPVMLKKSMFVDNKIKIEVNKDKAGQYENGVYYVNAVESFMNTLSSSPFVGANFIDIPVMPKPLVEDEDQLVSAGIRTWFTDYKNRQERVVRNSLASSYVNLFPTTINFYDYSTKDTEHPLKLRESAYLVSTFGQEINGMDMGNSYEISNYEFVTADPEELTITQQDGNIINLYYNRISSDADFYEPIVEKEEVDYGGVVDLTDNVTNLDELPTGTEVKDITPEGVIDTTQPGEYEGTIEITYPDGTSETIKVPVEVVDNRSDVDKYEPVVEKEEVNYGGEVDLTDNVTNLDELPTGTEVKDITPEGVIDTTQPGEYEGTIEITYPDGTSETVKVPVEVVDNRSDAEKYEPVVEKEEVDYGQPIDLTDNVTNLDELPEGTTVKDVTSNPIDTTQPGEYEGTIEITYPDGTSETVKVPVEVVDNRNDAEKYEPVVEKEEVNYGGEVDLTDNVTNLDELPTGTEVKDITPEGVIDTTQPGEYEGTIEITYPDGTSETVKVPVEVVDNRSDVDKYEPVVEKEEVNYGGEVDLTDNVTNLDELPTGTEVKDITPEGVIDTTQPGEYEGTIEITYPDGTSETVKVPVEVVDNRSDAEKYEPVVEKEEVDYGQPIDLTDNVTNLDELPEGTTVKDVTSNPIDTTQPGEYEGTIEITYPDGTSETVKVPVEVVDNRNDAEKYEPVVEKEEVNYGGEVDLTDNVTNLDELPTGTEVKDITPEGVIDTTQPGEYEGTIEITYPDGTSETVKVPVEVVDNRSDVDKYEPVVEKEEVNYGGEVDLTDNVTNLDELPTGTEVKDITPEGVIDTTQPGEYEGTIEITYPDGSSVIVEIPVTVKDKVDWVDINPIPTIGEDQILPEVVHKGEEADLTDNIINLPEGSTVEVVTPVDTDQVGEQTGEVKVTFPDGSSVIVEIPVTVKDKVDWVDINPIPTIDEDQILPEVVHKGEEADLTDNIINLPEGSTVEVVTPVDTDQVGEQTGEVKVTFPDGSSVIVEIPVTVKDKVDWVDINPIPTIGEDQILPEVVHKGEEADLTDNIINLPEGSTVEVVTPVDTDQVGEQTGKVKVTFPDGSSVIIEIPVTVKDKVDWVDINPIPTIDEDQILPEVVHKGEEADLTDNIINLPEGSTVEVVTPVDTDQVGEQTGEVKVTFPDGSSVIVEIPVTVKDKVDWVDINPIPTIGEDQILPEVVHKGEEADLTDNIINLPEGSTVEVVTPVDTDQVGEQTGEVKVTFPDGSSVIVEIPVTVKDKVDWVDINPIPTIGEDQILPEVVHKGEEADLTDNIINLPEGSTVEVVTPVDTDQVGEQTGKVKVTFPDGSSVIIEIPVTIKDNNNLSSTNKQYPVVLDVVRKNKNIDLSNATLKEDSIISKTDNKVLPQTGENDNSFFSILGMTLISVSSLLFGLFRKKEEK